MQFSSAKELLQLCEDNKCRISDVMKQVESERSELPQENIIETMRTTLQVMRKSCKQPLEEKLECIGGIIGGEGRLLKERMEDGKSLCGSLVTKAIIYSMSVLEQNSAMGQVVAAPTAGSSGVIPGVFLALEEERGMTEEQLVQGLFCAGAIGYLYMKNASVAGAQAGCQAEIGAASSMAAAAIVEMSGGTPGQCLDAASISTSNLLGLVCDPVAGLVQAPCQTRNATGAVNALTCAEIALGRVKAVVPFDEMLEVMMKVGNAMPNELKETSLGGTAATPTGYALKKKIFG